MTESRQDAGQQAERGEHEHGGQREAVGLDRAVAAAGVRGRPRKVDAEGLDEARRRQRRGQRQHRADRGHHELQAPIAAVPG